LCGDAADFDFGAAEVGQQAQVLARRPQVVPALRDMHVAQRRDHHEFDNGVVLDQGVGGCNNGASPLSTCILCIRLE
jgi:hypothetical protein